MCWYYQQFNYNKLSQITDWVMHKLISADKNANKKKPLLHNSFYHLNN